MLYASILAAAFCAAASAEPKPVAPKDAPTKPATPAATPSESVEKPLVPFPAPLITEILAAVPTGMAGDANKDGTRQVAGDEFIELVNPHSQPIDLGGYTLSDKTASEKTASGKPKSGGLKWTFPKCTLQPGQVVVVFNGYASTFKGPVGDTSVAPKTGNDNITGALVFSMKNPGERTGLSNSADWVLLSAPDGKPIQLIKWGDIGIKPPEGVVLTEDAPAATKGSVQRSNLRGTLAAHPPVGGVSFSPGVFESGLKPVTTTPEPAKEPAKPEPAPEKKVETPKPDEPAKPKW